MRLQGRGFGEQQRLRPEDIEARGTLWAEEVCASGEVALRLEVATEVVVMGDG